MPEIRSGTFITSVIAALLAGGAIAIGGAVFISNQSPDRSVSQVAPERILAPEWINPRMRVRTDILRQPPTGWPADTAWRPHRHFGPFSRGSDFENIQVVLGHGGTATWYHNDFFVGHPDDEIYRKYYGGTSPTDAAPAPSHIPGLQPTINGFNDLLLNLERVRYTSRYGGSVELLFRSSEDYEYEYRTASSSWDLGMLEMRIFVTPRAGVFNPLTTAPTTLFADVVVHLTAEEPQPRVETDESELMTALDQARTQIAADLKIRANQFVYGYMHAQFQEELPWTSTDKVTALSLTDDYLDFDTAAREPVVLLQERLEKIYAYGGDLFGEEEFSGFLTVRHFYKGGGVDVRFVFFPGGNSTLEPHESTYWLTLGQWRLNEFAFLDSVTVFVFMNEHDLLGQESFEINEFIYHVSKTQTGTITGEPEFGASSAGERSLIYTVGCPDLQAKAQLVPPELGTMQEEYRLVDLAWRNGSTAWGGYNLHSRTWLTFR